MAALRIMPMSAVDRARAWWCLVEERRKGASTASKPCVTYGKRRSSSLSWNLCLTTWSMRANFGNMTASAVRPEGVSSCGGMPWLALFTDIWITLWSVLNLSHDLASMSRRCMFEK